MTVQAFRAPACAPDHEQKRAALGYLHEAWAEARLDGIDGDCLAQACLFTAFAELVTTYGEEAAARFAEGLAKRIRNGEFSLPLARQYAAKFRGIRGPLSFLATIACRIAAV
jgi:hypothetical protein